MDLAYVLLVSPNLGSADMLLFVLEGRQMTEMLEACMKVGRWILLITRLPRLSPERKTSIQQYYTYACFDFSPVWMAKFIKHKNVFVAWYNYTHFTIHCLGPCMKRLFNLLAFRCIQVRFNFVVQIMNAGDELEPHPVRADAKRSIYMYVCI